MAADSDSPDSSVSSIAPPSFRPAGPGRDKVHLIHDVPGLPSAWEASDAGSHDPGVITEQSVREELMTEAEERVSAARQWAMSLRPTQGLRGKKLEDVRLVLPPLPALKEYVPGSASSGIGFHSAREGVFGAGPPMVQVPALPSSPEAFPEHVFDEPSHFQPPKCSVLGANAPLAWEQEESKAITSIPSRDAVRVLLAKQDVGKRRGCRQDNTKGVKFSQASKLPLTARESSRRTGPPKMTRMSTVVRPEGRPVVRGKDPMLGTLFSRETQLDPATQSKGVYEAQLRGKFAVL